MLSSVIWKKHLGRLASAGPLKFVAGFQHTVRARDYCGLHAHRAAEIVYHPSGRGQTLLGNRKWKFEEGSVVIYAPEEGHDQRMETSGEDLCIHIAVPTATSRQLRAGCYVPRLERPWLADGIRDLCRSRSVSGDSEQRVLDLRATAILLSLVELACATSNSDRISSAESKVTAAEQFMSEHFPAISSIRDVAEHVGVSHDYLRHLFKGVRGKSIVRHLNEIKIARARLLLLNTPLPLKQIATMCGFKDEYYFSAVFYKLTSTRPGAYRTRR
jgi:AraC-like DNA-binding protein